MGPAPQTIDEWLQGFFNSSSKKALPCSKQQQAQGNTIPIFERNKVTSQILKDLQDSNLTADFHVDKEIKVMKVLKEEYDAESCRLNKILEAFNLHAKDLSDDSLLPLITIISCGSRQVEILEDNPCEVPDLGSLSFNQTESLQRLQNLEKIRESLNHMHVSDVHVNAAKKRETEFLTKKINEYAGHIRHLEKKLEPVDSLSEIRHCSLEKRAKQLKAASDKLSQLRARLNLYSDLTPDIKLARIQVQNLKDEISQIERQITECISSINAS